jgi:hypothetical protein
MEHPEDQRNKRQPGAVSMLVTLLSFMLTGCVTGVAQTTPAPQVPHEER